MGEPPDGEITALLVRRQPGDANALEARLEQMDEQQCRVVELKFFAGLSNADAATALSISVSTVKRDRTTARALILREMAG